MLSVLGLAVAAVIRGGPTIIGPSEAVVGQEMAFAVAEADVQVDGWQVGDTRSTGPVLSLTPTSTGRVSVEVETSDGKAKATVTVRQADSTVQILGPGHIALGQVTTLSVDGAAGQGLTWTVGGETFRMPTLEVLPSQAGTLRVEVVTDGGDRVGRTFTIA